MFTTVAAGHYDPDTDTLEMAPVTTDPITELSDRIERWETALIREQDSYWKRHDPDVREAYQAMVIEQLLDEISETPNLNGKRSDGKAVLVDRLTARNLSKGWSATVLGGTDARRVSFISSLLSYYIAQRGTNDASRAKFFEHAERGFRFRGYSWATADVFALIREEAELDLIEDGLKVMAATTMDEPTDLSTPHGLHADISNYFETLEGWVAMMVSRHLSNGPTGGSMPHQLGDDAEREGERIGLDRFTSPFRTGRDSLKVGL